MSRYQPLAHYLSALDAPYIALSFDQIETILGGALPASAYRHSAWWANSRTDDSHSWAHLWIAAGWQVTDLDLPGRQVSFTRQESYDFDSPRAMEGYAVDRQILARHRNTSLALQRKQMDGYRCQACGFAKEIAGQWIIDVHHINPLAATGETQTRLEDLVSLCPTCHRIAHTQNPPLKLSAIRETLGLQSGPGMDNPLRMKNVSD